MKDWSQMGVGEQTEITLECFPHLSEQQIDNVLSIWATREYADDWHGHQKAQADLLALCRHESMSESQREREKERMREG